MGEGFNFNLTNLKVDQLGYVFKDIEKQAKIMEDLFGLDKLIFGKESTNVFNYRGSNSTIKTRMAFGRISNTQIELIQWIEGDCIYKEFLEQGKEGLHHIAVYVDDIQACINHFKQRGIELLQSGEILRHNFAYMDTLDTFGIYLEFLEMVKRKKKK